MQPVDLSQLTDDLLGYRSEGEIPSARADMVRAALPRCLATMRMIPDTVAGGDFLELGASPYLLTLCLRLACRGRMVLANYFGTERGKGRQRLVHQRTGDEIVLEYDHFDIERDEFPYADASFDVVIFSELIEHLGVNPVWALSEMHRVLRPGGLLIITTPNSLSLERLDAYLHGSSLLVDKYSPAHGQGARHNREYHAAELRELLEGTGYVIEELVLADLAAHSRAERLKRALQKGVLALLSSQAREEHLLVRARRGERFRWYFPPGLFTQVHQYHVVRHSYVEMGTNDAIQCVEGWGPLEELTTGGFGVRRITGIGKVFLRAAGDTARVGIELSGPAAAKTEARLVTRDRYVGTSPEWGAPYLDQAFTLDGNHWQTVEFPLGARPQPGDEVEVLLDAAVGTAVRRVWFDGESSS